MLRLVCLPQLDTVQVDVELRNMHTTAAWHVNDLMVLGLCLLRRQSLLHRTLAYCCPFSGLGI